MYVILLQHGDHTDQPVLEGGGQLPAQLGLFLLRPAGDSQQLMPLGPDVLPVAVGGGLHNS